MLDQVKDSNVVCEDVTFAAEDGWELAGSLYVGPAPKVAILISAGTGFPRRFYRHAAAWFAAQGAVVLTLIIAALATVGPKIWPTAALITRIGGSLI